MKTYPSDLERWCIRRDGMFDLIERCESGVPLDEFLETLRAEKGNIPLLLEENKIRPKPELIRLLEDFIRQTGEFEEEEE